MITRQSISQDYNFNSFKKSFVLIGIPIDVVKHIQKHLRYGRVYFFLQLSGYTPSLKKSAQELKAGKAGTETEAIKEH